MKYFIASVFMAIALSAQAVEPKASVPPWAEGPPVDLQTVVSDDLALETVFIRDTSGVVIGMIVTELTSGERFVFDTDELGPIPGRSAAPMSNQSTSATGDDSLGKQGIHSEIPDNATITLVECGGSSCLYRISIGDDTIGWMVVDTSGPQPKVSIVES